MNDTDRILEGLNPMQKKAVTFEGGPLLVLAGAGSGKTRVVTSRIAYLINELEVKPGNILALTFTNKACTEMKERAASLAAAAEDVLIKTFHSFGAWFLRFYSGPAGLSPFFTIYDTDDTVKLLGELFPETPKSTLKGWMKAISRAKNDLLQHDGDLLDYSSDPDINMVFKAYQEKMALLGNADFGDLLAKPVQVLTEYPLIKKAMQERFPVILVDEYQDTNYAQDTLLRELYSEKSWLCAVGDDDQSIYGFRGARVDNILEFADTFNNASIIKLEQNYRSTGNILKLAHAVVEHNAGRLGKKIFTEAEDGPVPVIESCQDTDQEAAKCLEYIRKFGTRGTAVLYRTNAQSRAIESILNRNGIAYRIVGSLRYFEREEVRDLMAYLKLLLNPDDVVAFARAINKPKRGIGEKTRQNIIGLAGEDNDLVKAAARFGASSPKRACEGAAAFAKCFEETAAMFGCKDLGVIMNNLAHESGLIDHYKDIDAQMNSSKIENIYEALRLASGYEASLEGICRLLENAALDAGSREDSGPADLTLITVHNTKGLEFDSVIITGVEDGLFPHYYHADNPDDIEEERRLFYVGITRAKRNLVLTYSMNRRVYNSSRPSGPSPFLEEIPADRFEKNEESEYAKGMAVYHDEYGFGKVTRVDITTGKPNAIHVRFNGGRSARFLEEFADLRVIHEEMMDY